MYETTYHRDDTVTFWDVHLQQWRRTRPPERGDGPKDVGLGPQTLSALWPESERIKVHCCVAPRDYVLRDTSTAIWPDALSFRSGATAPGRGYKTEDEARERARIIRDHLAAKGYGGPWLTVVARDKHGRDFHDLINLCGRPDDVREADECPYFWLEED